VTTPVQSSLFDGDTALVETKRPRATSAAQRKFEKLNADIQTEKARLEWLKDVSVALGTRAQRELLPLQNQFDAMRKSLAIEVDQALPRFKLKRADVGLLKDWVYDLCDSLLSEAGRDPALEEIFARHGRSSWAEVEKARADEASLMARDVAEEMFGSEILDGIDESDPELLIRQIHARIAAQHQSPKPRKQTPRQQEKQAQRERDAAHASEGVRAIYRRLVSSIHPDREPDPARRIERTALMQRINQAYENNDLIALLALEREALGEATDPTRSTDEQLAGINRVLEAQRANLRAEISFVRDQLRRTLEQPSAAMTSQKEIDAAFQLLADDFAKSNQELERELAQLRNPAQAEAYLMLIADSIRVDRAEARQRDRFYAKF
jgi:hypothetical protein